MERVITIDDLELSREIRDRSRINSLEFIFSKKISPHRIRARCKLSLRSPFFPFARSSPFQRNNIRGCTSVIPLEIEFVKPGHCI